jgi:hypothetical protein
MLKRVVKNHHFRSSRDCLSDPPRTIRRFNYRNIRVQSLMDERFVSAITAQNDSRFDSLLRKRVRDPRGNWSLAGSANGQIPDAHHSGRKLLRWKETRVVHPSPDRYSATVDQCDRGEQRAERARPPPPPGPGSLNDSADVRHRRVRLRR